MAALLSDTDFREIEKAVDVFCPFEAVGMARQEIRHGAFLSYILDPSRPHGLGDAALRVFLERVVETGAFESSDENFDRLSLQLVPLDGADVRREWRRIDLLIVVPMRDRGGRERRVVVAVELKIDAGETGNQLMRYHRTIRDTFPDDVHAFVYLTPDATPPNDEAEGVGWRSMELDDLIGAFAELTSDTDNLDGRGILHGYIRLMRRTILANDASVELARQIWQRHGEALRFLVGHQPDPVRDLLTELTTPEGAERLREKLRSNDAETRFKVTPHGRDVRIVFPDFNREWLRADKPGMPPEHGTPIILSYREEGMPIRARFEFQPTASAHREQRNDLIRRLKETSGWQTNASWNTQAHVTLRRPGKKYAEVLNKSDVQAIVNDEGSTEQVADKLFSNTAALMSEVIGSMRACLNAADDVAKQASGDLR